MGIQGEGRVVVVGRVVYTMWILFCKSGDIRSALFGSPLILAVVLLLLAPEEKTCLFFFPCGGGGKE